MEAYTTSQIRTKTHFVLVLFFLVSGYISACFFLKTSSGATQRE